MREYKYKAITDGSDFEDYVIKLNNIDTKEQVKEYLNAYYDDSIYWAKEINGNIFYSKDEVYNTEQQDATNLVIFMK